MIFSVSSLASQGYGIHRNVICVHAKTLEEATFKLNSASKMTETSYQHCAQFPTHGLDQGTANAPSIFLFISSQLFKAHSGKAHGMIFKRPDGKVVLHITIVGFLDNATVITGGTQERPIEQLLKRMHHDADLWNQLLWVSGGKLELSKCG